MNNFTPNKEFLHTILIHFYHMFINASEIKSNFSKYYNLDERTCDKWINSFKVGDFSYSDVEQSKSCEVFENKSESERKYGVIRWKITHRINGERHILMPGHYISISIPQPKKLFIRRLLLHYFYIKRTAAETHRILQNLYGDYEIPAETTCRRWFQQFRNGNFNLIDRARIGARKRFEDIDLRAILVKDPMQTQEKLAEVLGVSQYTISRRLKSMALNGMDRKMN